MRASKSEIKFVRSLHLKKFREAQKLFIAEGPKVVGELLASPYRVSKIFATEEYAEMNLSSKIVKDKVKIVSQAEIKIISALTTPNEVLAVAEIPERKISPSSINHSLSIALDHISDPGNLGTIIRIAHWFGIKNIICSENSVEPYNPKVVQAAMGSLFFVNVVQANLVELFASEKIAVPVYGTILDGKNIDETRPQSPAVILFGNESTGISSELKRFITHPLTIPSSATGHKPDSLNVAAAAAILCFTFNR